MDQVSLAKFKREVQTESLGKEGLIIDVRNNGGGSTAQDILGVLQRKPFVMRQRPHMPRISEDIYRGYALQKPCILLTNESSFSNAEIFSEGFKTLKLGKVVGVPTAGGVIGTGSFVLVDGSVLRLPAIGAWTIEGENLEGKGRSVDIYVEADPYEQDQGEDNQLKRAVEELLKTAK
jgi:C-terminal processing protease CtpA/Prc